MPPTPEDVLLHKGLAAKALQEGDIEGACGEYETALAMAATILRNPSPTTTSTSSSSVGVTKELVGILFANTSLCHFKLGRFEEALRDAEDAIKIHPRYVKGYYRAAQAHTALHQFKEAEGMVARGLVYSPDSAELKEFRKEIKMAEKLARISASKAGELGAVLVRGLGVYEDHIPIEVPTTSSTPALPCPLLSAIGIDVEVVPLPNTTTTTTPTRIEGILVCDDLQQAVRIYQSVQPPTNANPPTPEGGKPAPKKVPQPPPPASSNGPPKSLSYPFVVQYCSHTTNNTAATRGRITKAEVYALVDFIQSLCVSVDEGGETPAVACLLDGDSKTPLHKVPTVAHLAEWQVSYNLLAKQPLLATAADLKAGVFVDLQPVRFSDVPDAETDDVLE